MDSSRPTIRRQKLRLPSRRKHVLLAGLCLLGGFAIPFLLTATFGNPKDAIPGGRAAISAPPPALALSGLDNEALSVPDLLEGEVPLDKNPTELIDQQDKATASVEDGEKHPIISSLKAVPVPGLTRESAFGPVPQIRVTPNGTKTALSAYRRPFKPSAGHKPVSIIIGGLGLNPAMTRRAIEELPANVTLSFAAHTRGLQSWVERARTFGHEVLLEIPMEDIDFNPNEAGAKYTLRLDATPRDNVRNLEWALSRAQGFCGVTHYNGEAFLTRTDVSAPFINSLSETGLGFITDGAFATPTLPTLTSSVGLPFKSGHGIIDPSPIPELINAELYNLSNAAKTQPHPIGFGYAYPETINMVLSWTQGLTDQKLQLAPACSSLL